jgi:magnesium transporter
MPRSAPESTPADLYRLHDDPVALAALARRLRAADIGDALTRLPPAEAAAVVAALPFDLAVQAFDDPEIEPRRSEIVHELPAAVAVRLVEAMAADQQARLFRALDFDDRDRLLPQLDGDTRQALARLLAYPDDTAGGLMTTEYVGVPSTWTAEETLRHIAQVGHAKETVYAVFVIEPATQALVHTVSLRQLMLAPAGQLVTDIGDRRPPIVVTPDQDREDAVRIIGKYNLLALPVVDEDHRVLGIVTVDDVIDAMVREQTEDVQKLGGMTATDDAYMEMGFRTNVRKRAPWLAVLFIGQTFTATAMGYFGSEIERAVILAIFIPLIISSGGNTGSQATSLIIRAMALRDVTLADWWRVAVREAPVGLTLGLLLGVLGAGRIIAWQQLGWYEYGPHYMLIAATVLVALVGVVTLGSLVGSMLPFLLRRIGFDPASASAPFVATVVDVAGIVIYFGVAFLLLRGVLL